DGIRDKLVTGVQTCALPIFLRAKLSPVRNPGPSDGLRASTVARSAAESNSSTVARSQETNRAMRATQTSATAWGERASRIERSRSEERRVGKECRARGWRSP